MWTCICADHPSPHAVIEVMPYKLHLHGCCRSQQHLTISAAKRPQEMHSFADWGVLSDMLSDAQGIRCMGLWCCPLPDADLRASFQGLCPPPTVLLHPCCPAASLVCQAWCMSDRSSCLVLELQRVRKRLQRRRSKLSRDLQSLCCTGSQGAWGSDACHGASNCEGQLVGAQWPVPVA